MFHTTRKSLESPASEERIHLVAIGSSEEPNGALMKIAGVAGWRLQIAGTLSQAANLLRQASVAVVILYCDPPGFEWHSGIAAVAKEAPRASVVLASRINDEYLVREVVARGGYDVLTLPLEERRTIHTVNRAWSHFRSREARRLHLSAPHKGSAPEYRED